MGAPSSALINLMAANGYVPPLQLVREMKLAETTVIRYAQSVKGAVIRSGRFRFVKAEAVKEARAEHEQRMVAIKAKGAESHLARTPKGDPAVVPTRTVGPPTVQFWAKMRELIREEVAAALSRFEVATQERGDENGVSGHS